MASLSSISVLITFKEQTIKDGYLAKSILSDAFDEVLIKVGENMNIQTDKIAFSCQIFKLITNDESVNEGLFTEDMTQIEMYYS